MGRPKGSKNKPRDIADINSVARETMAEIKAPGYFRSVEFDNSPGEATAIAFPTPPAVTKIALTDEDLAPARRAKAKHERAAAEYKRQEIQSEMRRRDAGEIEDLSVPQVVDYDLSEAFHKIAQQKARAAGYRYYANLRKTPEGWVFDAYKHNPRLDHDKAPDQL